MGRRNKTINKTGQVHFAEQSIPASSSNFSAKHNGNSIDKNNDDYMKPDGRGLITSPSVNTLNRLERAKIVFWFRPLQTAHYAFRETVYLLKQLFIYLWRRKRIVLSLLLLCMLLMLVYVIPGRHQSYVLLIEKQIMLCFYWLGLGVLSSIGLGTGLHTFILYLGPHIASVTMAAYECNSLEFPNPPYPEMIICPNVEGVVGKAVTIWAIMSKVRFEALMWGAGTALGELPPYFMAKAARISGEEPDDEEYREFLAFINQNSPHTPSFTDRCKITMEKIVANLGFIGILVFASVPNPFFDLAGITCGHFLVPFWTFFGATLIGKAILKMHIQMLLVVLAFSEGYVELLISHMKKIPYVGLRLQSPLKEFLTHQKIKLHNPDSSMQMNSTMLQKMLACLVTGMILWFAISILNSLAQRWHKRLCDERKKTD